MPIRDYTDHSQGLNIVEGWGLLLGEEMLGNVMARYLNPAYRWEYNILADFRACTKVAFDYDHLKELGRIDSEVCKTLEDHPDVLEEIRVSVIFPHKLFRDMYGLFEAFRDWSGADMYDLKVFEDRSEGLAWLQKTEPEVISTPNRVAAKTHRRPIGP